METNVTSEGQFCYKHIWKQLLLYMQHCFKSTKDHLCSTLIFHAVKELKWSVQDVCINIKKQKQIN